MFVNLSLGQHSTAGYFDDVLEYALAHLIDGFSPVDYSTGRKVEVILHSLENRGI